ncbi:MAG: GAF domain-containing protein [Oculatellaceae cyanobacterium bins.114]|nr:GAF domain-containing protein [Oculatellaceae cyanobacterium bins.114]
MTFFSSLTNNWLTHQFRNPAQQSALLRKIVDRIRTSLELKVVLQTAVDEVAELLQLDRCIFFWHFKDRQQVQVVCERLHSNHPSHLGDHPLHKLGSAAPLINRGEIVISAGHVSGLERWLNHFIQPPTQTVHTHEIFGAKASLLVPVRGRERSIGFIACLVDEPRQWSAPEVEFIQLIAQRLEIAVRQAQLYEQMQQQAQREKLINQITTQTRQSLDLKTILTKAIAHLQKALDADRCLVHLVENLDDDCDSSSEYYEPGINQTIFRRKHLFEVCRSPYPPAFRDFNTDGPITKWVIRTRQQVVIPDITQDPRIGPDNIEYRLAQIKSSLVVPVRANGTLQAILYLNQCSHVRYWSRDDQKLAQAVADQLAISIKQAHLYAQSRQQAAESAEHARSLTETLKHLQHVQAQLIQSEKMSSLGQMVAGIAHEINNPVSFIYGNIPYVEQYVQDLLRLLDAYERHCPQASEELKELTREIELDFLTKDLPRILTSMQFGANRIREIVLSLRSFSRLDEAHCKVADVNVGLDDTLLVLQSHIKADVNIVRHYGKLPRVECYPRQLNQVFMNLLMNAIEALNHPQPDPKVIKITTEVISHDVTQQPWVRIAITDNGCGIDYDIQPKIFEPFFTTKKTGQGAGLGLAVSYQTIVNQHQGFLGVESEPGHGSTFVIEIPVKHSDLRVRNRNLYLFSGVNPPTRTNVKAAIAKRDLS